jgi:hypothetical protein
MGRNDGYADANKVCLSNVARNESGSSDFRFRVHCFIVNEMINGGVLVVSCIRRRLSAFEYEDPVFPALGYDVPIFGVSDGDVAARIRGGRNQVPSQHGATRSRAHVRISFEEFLCLWAKVLEFGPLSEPARSGSCSISAGSTTGDAVRNAAESCVTICIMRDTKSDLPMDRYVREIKLRRDKIASLDAYGAIRSYVHFAQLTCGRSFRDAM